MIPRKIPSNAGVHFLQFVLCDISRQMLSRAKFSSLIKQSTCQSSLLCLLVTWRSLYLTSRLISGHLKHILDFVLLCITLNFELRLKLSAHYVTTRLISSYFKHISNFVLCVLRVTYFVLRSLFDKQINFKPFEAYFEFCIIVYYVLRILYCAHYLTSRLISSHLKHISEICPCLSYMAMTRQNCSLFHLKPNSRYRHTLNEVKLLLLRTF